MKKVLVIGAHSYIGQQFKEYVSRMKRNDISLDLVSAYDGSWCQVDFSLYDTILHLSGIVHKKERKNMESLYFQVNHKLAVQVARKAKENHVKQFVFMSTAAVFGITGGCITKKTVPDPVTYYGKSKFAAENDIIKLKDLNFDIAIVRPPMVYGIGCKGNYPKLAKLAKYMSIFPDYENKRSMIHIDNLCAFILRIIVSNESGYFHPQDNEYVKTSQLVVKIRKEMGKDTHLTNFFNIVIHILNNKILSLNKIFGDFYFSKDISKIDF